MKIGLNLGSASESTTACMFMDRVRMSRVAQTGRYPIPAYDSRTGFPREAGKLTLVVPIDPASKENPRTWVLLCDENVATVGLPWGTMRPVNGRATFTVKSDSPGVNLGVTATGPVKKLAFIRADHEAAYLDGAVRNPDFVNFVRPFPVLRALDLVATNHDPVPMLASFPPNRPTPADGRFSVDRGGVAAEYIAALVKETDAQAWHTIHHLTPDAQIVQIAKAYAAAGARAHFEYSNEFGWTFHAAWAKAQALKSYGSTAYPNILRWYGRRAGQIAQLINPIFPGFLMELASQASNGRSNLPYILEGWDASGAPRSMIAGYSNSSYLNLNSILPVLLDAMDRDDPEAFYAAVDGLRPALKARHVKMVTACVAEKIKPKAYEAGAQLFLQRVNIPQNKPTPAELAAWDARRAALLKWVLPLWHSERMADIEMGMIRDAFDAGLVEVNKFQATGPGSQFGVWGTAPHVTLPPYPIYNRLLAA